MNCLPRNHLLRQCVKYERRAMAHHIADCDWDIELRYEAWAECYAYTCIRDAIRYPGRVAEPTLKQWLDDHRQEYEDAKVRIYEKLENHTVERYRTGYVRNWNDMGMKE